MILLYAAKATEMNNAVALKEYIEDIFAWDTQYNEAIIILKLLIFPYYYRKRMAYIMNTEDQEKLLKSITSALHETFNNTNLHEPQLVANLVWHLPHHLNSTLLSHGNFIKTGGVFIHAHPFVKIDHFPDKTQNYVELGDLLLLRTAYRNGQLCDRRAILLQAKKIDSIPARPDNINQHHLYANWPIFEYVRSSRHLNGQLRHLRGPDLYNATKYLLIGNEDAENYRICCNYYGCEPAIICSCLQPILTAHPSAPQLSHYYCFARELLDFILGNSGKPYSTEVHHAETGWNMVIKDLTSCIGLHYSKFMSRASRDASRARSAGSNTFFVSGKAEKQSILSKIGVMPEGDSSFGRDVPPDVPDREYIGDYDDDGGISALEFTVHMEGTE